MEQERVTELLRRLAPIFVLPNDPSEQRGAGDITSQEKIEVHILVIASYWISFDWLDFNLEAGKFAKKFSSQVSR